MNDGNWQKSLDAKPFTTINPTKYRVIRSKVIEKVEGSPCSWITSDEFANYNPTVPFEAEELPALISVRGADGKLKEVPPTFMETRNWLKEQHTLELEHKKHITDFNQATTMLATPFDQDLKRQMKAKTTWREKLAVLDDHFLGPKEEAARGVWQEQWDTLKVKNGDYMGFIRTFRELREQQEILFEAPKGESQTQTDSLFVESARKKLSKNKH